MKTTKIILSFLSFLLVCNFAYAEGGFNWFGAPQKKEEAKEVKTGPQQVKKEIGVAAKATGEENKEEDLKRMREQELQRQLGAQNLAVLQMRLANNKSMTEEQKKELADLMGKHFPENAVLSDKENEKSLLFFEQIANDPNMKFEEKTTTIQAYDPSAGKVAAEAGEETKAGTKAVAKAEPVAEAQAVKKEKKARKQAHNFSSR